MEKVIKIIMRRDRLTRDEATDLVEETAEAMIEAIEAGDLEEAETILAQELGLEPDYLFDLIPF